MLMKSTIADGRQTVCLDKLRLKPSQPKLELGLGLSLAISVFIKYLFDRNFTNMSVLHMYTYSTNHISHLSQNYYSLLLLSTAIIPHLNLK